MRIVLAEPHTLVRAGLRRLLEEGPGVEVIGEAGDGQQLLELCGRLRPDVVMTELHLSQISGLEALAQIRRHYPEIAVVILAAPSDGHHVRAAIKSGAAGFIAKDAEPMELGLALRAIERRQIYLSPAISHKAIERRADERAEDNVALTPRQRQVLQLIGRGKSTKEIAALMGISVKTVETHRARLMQALGLYGTNALMRHAIRHSLDYSVV